MLFSQFFGTRYDEIERILSDIKTKYKKGYLIPRQQKASCGENVRLIVLAASSLSKWDREPTTCILSDKNTSFFLLNVEKKHEHVFFLLQ